MEFRLKCPDSGPCVEAQKVAARPAVPCHCGPRGLQSLCVELADPTLVPSAGDVSMTSHQ